MTEGVRYVYPRVGEWVTRRVVEVMKSDNSLYVKKFSSFAKMSTPMSMPIGMLGTVWQVHLVCQQASPRSQALIKVKTHHKLGGHLI